MITNFGKNLISKYLLGQIDSYANYIGIGTGGVIGTTPVTQQTLNFEAARYAIISKGLSVDSSGNRQLVFTAEIDNLDRFDISEIGLFPAAYDSLLSGSVGSKMLLDFSNNESWKYNDTSLINTQTPTGTTNITITTTSAHNFSVGQSVKISGIVPYQYNGTWTTQSGTTASTLIVNIGSNPGAITTGGSVVSYELPLTFISNPLDYANTTNILDAQSDNSTLLKAYSFNANNSFFTTTRIERFERPRIYNSSLLVVGDMSTTYNTGKYIELTGFNNVKDLDNASAAIDELRIAFTVINTTALTSSPSGGVQFTIRFYTNDGQTYKQYVFDTANSLNTYTTWIKSLGTSARYVIGKQLLSDGESNGDFKWSAVNTVRIYGKATDATSSANYAIIFDALRFENNSTINPLYGLLGYSVPSSIIEKTIDTTGLIEFRFNLGVA
jgi:hypothetical protein